jgi:hypothetical protein
MGKEVRLLFVNKDAVNFNSHEHRAQVNSFVQRGPKRGKEERLQKLRASTVKFQHTWRLGDPHHASTIPRTPKPRVVDRPADARHGYCTQSPEEESETAASGQLFQVSKERDGPILNDPLCMSALQEQLDPFIRLAGKTTRKERNLLHYCKFAGDPQAQVKQVLTGQQTLLSLRLQSMAPGPKEHSIARYATRQLQTCSRITYGFSGFC